MRTCDARDTLMAHVRSLGDFAEGVVTAGFSDRSLELSVHTSQPFSCLPRPTQVIECPAKN